MDLNLEYRQTRASGAHVPDRYSPSLRQPVVCVRLTAKLITPNGADSLLNYEITIKVPDT